MSEEKKQTVSTRPWKQKLTNSLPKGWHKLPLKVQESHWKNRTRLK